MTRTSRAFAALSVIVATLSCNGETPIGPTIDVQNVAKQLEVILKPTTATSGFEFEVQPVINVLDANRQIFSAASIPVTVSVTRGSVTLEGTVSVNAVAGVVTFTDLQVNGGGDFTLTFSAPGLNPASFNLTSNQTPAALGVLTQPNGAETGLPFTSQPVVRLLDHAGIPITDTTFQVTASVGNGSGTLGGTATVSSVGGLATFTSLAITGSGPHSLQFVAGSLTAATSVDFVVAGVTQLVISQQPDSGAINTTFKQPILELRGASNTLMRGATGSVTAAVASGSGTLSGTATVTAVAGVATFTSLKLSNKGPHTLTFSSPGVPDVTSDTFKIVAPPVALTVDTVPAGAVSGNAFTTQPVISVLDAANQKVSDATVPVTVSVLSGSATLAGTTTVNAVAGVAKFTTLRLDGSGTVTLRFASPGLTTVTATITVTQTPGSLVIITHPNGAGTGVAFATQPVVRVLDQAGLIIGNATTPITAAKATGTGTLSGTATVSAVNGVATFTNLSIVGGGAHTLIFSATGVTSATSAAFTVTQTAVSLAVATQPAGATKDVVFLTQPVVQVRDGANGLVLGSTALVTASVATGTGALIGTTSVQAVNGVATFTNLQLNAAGAHTLRFSSSALTSATSSELTVTGPPTAISLQTEPGGAVSGKSLTTQPAVTLRDAANLVAVGSTAPVTATLASGTGTLIGTTVVNAVAGVATFTNLRVDGSGSHTISFTSGALTAATSAAFTVTQTPISLGMQTQPAGAETGQNLGTQPVVRVLDDAGLQVAGGTTSVTAAIASGTGTLTGTTTVAASNGLATFTDLKVIGGGPHSLQFTATGLTPTTSTQFTIVQTPVSLGIATQPGGATLGLVLTTPPAIQVRDALNNVVAGSTAPVTVAVASGSGTLSGTTTVNAVDGIATFDNISLSAAGAHTLTFTSGSLTLVTSASFSVSQAAAKLSIQTQPSGAVSGLLMTSQPVVRVLDALDNLAGGFTGIVTAAIASGTGELTGTVSLNAVGGVATFPDLTIAGADSHTLTFTSGALTSATSNAFTVTQTPFQLAILTQPSGSVSGSVLTGQPVIQVRDHAGLRIMTSTLAVTATVASSGVQTPTVTLVGTATVNAVQGEATFTNLRLDGGGSHSLNFNGSGVNGATSNSVTTTQNAITLVMDRQPAGASSGVALTTQPRVRVEDVTQSVVLGATTAITAAIASGGGTLSGTNPVNAQNGVATFTNLQISGGGSHTLTFTATSLTPATSSAFTVAQTAASLGMETQPAGAVSGVNMTTQPAVRIRDGGGQLIGNATNSVTVTLASGSGTLVGTTTVNAVDGIARFTNLRINGVGAHTLQFASSGLTGVTSGSVTVTQQAAALAMETQPGGASSGVIFVSQPRVRILDNAGLQVQGATNAVTTAIGSGTGALSGTVTVNASNGLATFAGLAITGEGLHTMNFTSGSLTATSSSSFLVTGIDGGGDFLIHPSCEENPTPPVPAPLRVFYVDAVNGDDANTGTTIGAAWRTLGKANNTLIAGDLAYLKGVFSGQDIKPLNSGTASNKITYRALPDDSARIALGAGGVALSFSGRSHIVVDRIAVTGVLTPVLIRNNSHHIWLFNMTILDGGTSEINNSDDNWIDRTLIQRTGTAGGSGDALLIKNGSDRNYITRNTLREAGHASLSIGPTSASDATAVDNKVLQNNLDNPWGTGMFLGPKSQGTLLECNRIHNAGTSSTLQTGLDVDGASHVIRFNEVFQNGVYGILLRGKTFSASALAAVSSELFDNSVWGNTTGSIHVVLTYTP